MTSHELIKVRSLNSTPRDVKPSDRDRIYPFHSMAANEFFRYWKNQEHVLRNEVYRYNRWCRRYNISRIAVVIPQLLICAVIPHKRLPTIEEAITMVLGKESHEGD